MRILDKVPVGHSDIIFGIEVHVTLKGHMSHSEIKPSAET